MDLDSYETKRLPIIELLSETNKAWHIKLKKDIHWFPKSQCRVVGNILYTPEWLLEKNDIDWRDNE